MNLFSGKRSKYDLLIQPVTTSISIVDDYKEPPAEPKKKKTPEAPKSAKSNEFVENYVEDQTRRTSIKTNAHILCDTDDELNKEAPSLNSTPRHTAGKTRVHQIEIDNVKSELAQIQNAIETVKKEMDQIQKKRNLKQDSIESRPQSGCSNKTFVFDNEEDYENKKRPKTSMSRIRVEENVKAIPNKSSSLENIASDIQSTIDTVVSGTSGNEVYDSTENNNTNEDMSEHSKTDETPDDMTVRNDETDYQCSNDNENRKDSTSSSTKSLQEEKKGSSIDSNSQNDEDISYAPAKMKPKRGIPIKKGSKIMSAKNILPNHPVNPAADAQNKIYLGNEMFPMSLRRFEKPKDALFTCLSQLDSTNWEAIMSGLQTFVRLIRHHPEYVDAHVHLLTIALSKQVKNLRSQVARAAALASNEFFMTHYKVLDVDGEELAAALLHRTADTNKFLRNDAITALETMVDYLHPNKVIIILTFRGATHQNAIVRCTTAKLLDKLVFRIGCDKVFSLQKDLRDKIILTAANFLMEGSLETRNYTKDLFKKLSLHHNYQKTLLEVIPHSLYRNIEKSLKSIR